MAWIVAPNIRALFASINKVAPNRDRASDGTIGDYAHSTEVSGHNPDDTSGTRAERTDSDSMAEVRAGDVDTDLRQPGLTMERIVQTVVRTPALRNRLIYVIYNRRIWAASSGWAERPYTGSNPHDHHAHFSGHPDRDNDSSPWREIEALEDDVSLTTTEHDWLESVRRDAAWVRDFMYRALNGQDTASGGENIELAKWVRQGQADRSAILASLATLSGKDFTDEPAIAAAVLQALTPEMFAQAIKLAGLTPEALAELIPETMADGMVDALAARLTRP